MSEVEIAKAEMLDSVTDAALINTIRGDYDGPLILSVETEEGGYGDGVDRHYFVAEVAGDPREVIGRTPMSVRLKCGEEVDVEFRRMPAAMNEDVWGKVRAMRAKGLRPILTPDWGSSWQVVLYRRDEYLGQTRWHDEAADAVSEADSLVASQGW